MYTMFLVALLMFAIGIVAGHYLWPTVSVQVVRETVPVYIKAPEVIVPRQVSPDRQSVLFRFASGAREQKTLFKHSLQPSLPWRGKTFMRSEDKDSTAIYEEVMD